MSRVEEGVWARMRDRMMYPKRPVFRSRPVAIAAVALLELCGCAGSDAESPSGVGAGGAGAQGGLAGDGASAGQSTTSVGGGGGTSELGAGGMPVATAGGNAGGNAVSGGAGSGGTTGGAGASAEGGSGGLDNGGGASGAEVGGAAGEGAGGEMAGAGGAPTEESERFACPDGPLGQPEVVSSRNICGNFNFKFTWNEGPTWVASEGAFFFSNFVALSANGGQMIKYTPGEGCEVFIDDIGCNGLAVANDGGLLAACQETRSILHIDLKTKERTTVADSYMGQMLDTPNDLIQHSNGTVYFTNPTNELAGRPVGVGPGAFSVSPDGTVNRIAQGNCNGIGLSPDESRLYVILMDMWDLDAQGAPSNRQTIFTRGDGMAVDCAGNVYADGNIYNPGGQNIGNWGSGTNLAFGGEDGKTVLVTGPGTQLRELTMSIPGFP